MSNSDNDPEPLPPWISNPEWIKLSAEERNKQRLEFFENCKNGRYWKRKHDKLRRRRERFKKTKGQDMFEDFRNDVSNVTEEDLLETANDYEGYWKDQGYPVDMCGDVREKYVRKIKNLVETREISCKLCKKVVEVSIVDNGVHCCQNCGRIICDDCIAQCDGFDDSMITDGLNLQICKMCTKCRCPTHGCIEISNKSSFLGATTLKETTPHHVLVEEQPHCRRCIGLPCIICLRPADGQIDQTTIKTIFKKTSLHGKSQQRRNFFREHMIMYARQTELKNEKTMRQLETVSINDTDDSDSD